MLSTEEWHRRLYPDPDSQSTVPQLMRRVERHVRAEHRVLDLGAGAGELNAYNLKGRCREMVGVDMDPRVATNPLLDVGVRADANHLPFENESFDVAFSVYVMEHVEDPGSFVSEVWRVLRPGGVFLALTPNRWHYVALAASLTPMAFHRWYNRKRGRADDDTFPTVYRLNTRREQRKWFEGQGFVTEEIAAVEIDPKYLMFSLPTFLAGALYERIVNSTWALEGLRVNLISTFRKPSPPS